MGVYCRVTSTWTSKLPYTTCQYYYSIFILSKLFVKRIGRLFESVQAGRLHILRAVKSRGDACVAPTLVSLSPDTHIFRGGRGLLKGVCLFGIYKPKYQKHKKKHPPYYCFYIAPHILWPMFITETIFPVSSVMTFTSSPAQNAVSQVIPSFSNITLMAPLLSFSIKGVKTFILAGSISITLSFPWLSCTFSFPPSKSQLVTLLICCVTSIFSLPSKETWVGSPRDNLLFWVFWRRFLYLKKRKSVPIRTIRGTMSHHFLMIYDDTLPEYLQKLGWILMVGDSGWHTRCIMDVWNFGNY